VDNSDRPALRDALDGQVPDARIRYHYDPHPMDMCANFERGAAAARGVYIGFVGDDDGVAPELVDAARWAQKERFDAVVPRVRSRYYWPDHRSLHFGSAEAGELHLTPFRESIRVVNPDAELKACLRSAGNNFHALPKVYYGIVRTECLMAARKTAGTCFPGPSPDLAGAVSVALVAPRVAEVDYPLFVPGTCSASMGGLGAMKRHEGELRDFAHLPSQCVENWSEVVPAFFSGPTVWAENVVQALRAAGRHALSAELNEELLCALCLVFHPAFHRVTLAHFAARWRAQGWSLPRAGKVAWYAGDLCAQRLRALLRRLARSMWAGSMTTIGGLANIEAAVRAQADFLSRNGKSFAAMAGL
jgi:hypothetical protein